MSSGPGSGCTGYSTLIRHWKPEAWRSSKEAPGSEGLLERISWFDLFRMVSEAGWVRRLGYAKLMPVSPLPGARLSRGGTVMVPGPRWLSSTPDSGCGFVALAHLWNF